VGATTPTTHRARRSDRRRTHDDGSALVLVPALLMVLLALGAIAIDLSVLHGAHRSLHRIASGAADDAAAMIDTERLQVDGELRIDGAAARRVVDAHLDAAQVPGSLASSRTSVSADGDVVTVELTSSVDHVLLASLPGTERTEAVSVTVRARLQR
jgi:Flp pilus assembly protein TadG